MELWSVGVMGGDFGFVGVAASNANGRRVRDAHQRAKKNVPPQQLIDGKYLHEMVKSGFNESLWGRERIKK